MILISRRRPPRMLHKISHSVLESFMAMDGKKKKREKERTGRKDVTEKLDEISYTGVSVTYKYFGGKSLQRCCSPERAT